VITVRSSGGKKRLAGYVIFAYTPEPAKAAPSTPQPPSP
jgi:hypothetical protein